MISSIREGGDKKYIIVYKYDFWGYFTLNHISNFFSRVNNCENKKSKSKYQQLKRIKVRKITPEIFLRF